MITLKKLLILSLLILACNCNNDDDGNSEPLQFSTEQLLVSGKWYFESKIPGAYTDCEKRGYLEFMNNGILVLNSFDDGSGSCESLGEVVASYTLSNDVTLTIVFGSESQSAAITSISENQLKITNTDDGESIVFDKTEG